MSDLIKRLRHEVVLSREVTPDIEIAGQVYAGGETVVTMLRNPDGPEAADRITALEAENARLRDGLERINGFTMSQFASAGSMAAACISEAAATLKNRDTPTNG